MTKATSQPDFETVLVAGDWHGDTGWAKSVIQSAGHLGVTKLLHVGDLGVGPWPGDKGGATLEHKLNGICAKNRVDLFAVPGNHENWETIEHLQPRADGWLELRERVLVAPGGLRWTWSGVAFGALGGAFSVDAAHRVAEKDWWGLLQGWLTLHLWDEVPLEGCRCAQEAPARVQA